jgi:hypothetical protein
VPGASHLKVARDARPGRILRAVPQVMSLQREHDSNSGDIVSHPNAQDQLPGRLRWTSNNENRNAGPVNCIRSLGKNNLGGPFCLHGFGKAANAPSNSS